MISLSLKLKNVLKYCFVSVQHSAWQILSLCLINYLANERLNEWEIIRPNAFT
jgi:hypothetical protein